MHKYGKLFSHIIIISLPLLFLYIVRLNFYFFEIPAFSEQRAFHILYWLLSYILYFLCVIALLIIRGRVSSRWVLAGILEILLISPLFWFHNRMWHMFFSQFNSNILMGFTLIILYIYLFLDAHFKERQHNS